MDSNKIISLGNGTSAQDAVTYSQLLAVNATGGAPETDPKWSANYSDYLTTKSLTTNGTFYLASNPSSYTTIPLVWATLGNGTMMTGANFTTQNTSMVNYIGTVNTSMKNYVDSQISAGAYNDTWINQTIYNKTQVDAINTSMKNYVDVQNTSQTNAMTAQNTSQTNYINVVAARWNSNYTNMQTNCGSGFVIGIYSNGTFMCGSTSAETDPKWTANYSAFNATWSNTTNMSYVPYIGATQNVDLGANNLTVDTNVLHVDATNDRVGIGTTSPQAKLDVQNGGVNIYLG